MAFMVMSSTVMAQSLQFNVDGLGLMGNSSYKVDGDELTTKDWGFAVNAQVEVYPNVLLEGNFSSSWATKKMEEEQAVDLTEGDAYRQNLVLAGAKYRVLADNGMDFFVGAGYGRADVSLSQTTAVEAVPLTEADLEKHLFSGWGVYGKAGVVVAINQQFSIRGDVAYSPAARFTSDDVDEIKGSLLSGRGVLAYSINPSMGVQVGVVHNTVSGTKGDDGAEFKGNFSATMYGAGLVLSF